MHSKTLLQILKQLSPAISQNPVLPALENVCIRNKKASATNLSLTISIDCDLPDMMLPYFELQRSLSVSNGEIEIKTKANTITLKCGEDVFKFKTDDINSFPVASEIKGKEYEVNEDFFYAIQMASRNERTDNTDARFEGFVIRKNYIGATDAHSLYKQQLQTDIEEIHIPSSISKSTVGWISGKVKTDGKHFTIESEGKTVDVLALEQKFPDINIVIRENVNPNVIIDRALFEIAIKKVQAFESGTIIMKFSKDKIDLFYTNEFNSREAASSVNAEHNLSIELSVNSAILMRLISCLPDSCSIINMEIIDSTKALIIIHENITLLIMPLMA